MAPCVFAADYMMLTVMGLTLTNLFSNMKMILAFMLLMFEIKAMKEEVHVHA